MKRRRPRLTVKRRDPSSFLKSLGALRTRTYADRRKKTGRKVKHKKADDE